MAPDKALIDDIENFIMSYDKPLGIHDLMMHDYGPGRMFMTLHVEVDCQEDVMKIHEEIDDIERAIQENIIFIRPFIMIQWMCIIQGY